MDEQAKGIEEPTEFLTDSTQAVVEPPAKIVNQDLFWSEAFAQMFAH